VDSDECALAPEVFDSVLMGRMSPVMIGVMSPKMIVMYGQDKCSLCAT
jgi:hypothetical protein